MSPSTTNYGLLAEFDEADALIEAVWKVREAGYRDIDAFSPFPLEGLSEALAEKKSKIPLITLISGIVGGLTGFVMQWYSAVIDYPIMVGGKPLNSLPTFVLVIFELTILFAASGAFFGHFVLNRLPTLYHPLFNVAAFDRASTDGFFICVEATDEHFDPDATRRFLTTLGAREVYDVPA